MGQRRAIPHFHFSLMLLGKKATAVYSEAGKGFRGHRFCCVNMPSLGRRNEKGTGRRYAAADARSARSVLSQRISLQARAPWEEARHGPRSGPWGGHRAARPCAVAGGKRGISGARREPSHQLELGLDQPPEKAGVHSRYESTEQFHRATDCVVKWINSSQRTL